MSSVDLGKKSLIFITGASRGIGRAIAVKLTHFIHPDSTLVLSASTRSKELEETKALISQVQRNLNVILYPLNLSKPSSGDSEKLFDEVISKLPVPSFENSIFIHNAGTIGTLKKTVDLDDVDSWRNYYSLNLISAISLNSKFIAKTRDLAKKLFVVNVTSLCGRVPFVNMSMYGSCKAARELFFKVLAKEEKDVTVLNYSPGPVDTQMFDNIINLAEDEGLKKDFKETKSSGILTPEKTVEMLLDILRKGEYQSGDTIDYYDKVPQ